MSLKRALVVVAAGALAAAGSMASVALSAGPAAAATTTQVALPFTGYAGMVVDPANQHLFVTGGVGSSSILVTSYSGHTVATIPNEPGASGLALSGDGSTVYVALASANAISAISTSTLTETARYATGAGTDPAYVAYTSGKVWFGYGPNAGPAGIGSVDPGTSPATVTLNATNDPGGTWYSAPELTASPAGDLVAGQPGLGALELASYDVSTGTATTLAPRTYLGNYAGLAGMQITPDGTDVVVATGGGSRASQTIFQVSDLSVVGDYPTGFLTAGVAIAGDGTVAAGAGFPGKVYLFAPGGSVPLNTYDLGAHTLIDLALSPDVGELFVVVLEGVTFSGRPPRPTRHYALTIITDPAQTPSTLTLAGPDAAVKHDTPVTLTGTLGGVAPYSGGQTLTVTRTDSAEPDGVALPDVTTAADGTFTITDTPPKMHANQGVVSYQFSYAGDPLLTASSATFSVTVQPGNGNDNNS